MAFRDHLPSRSWIAWSTASGRRQWDGDMSGVVDKAVLAVRDRFGQRGVEPPLAFDLLA